LREKNFGNKNDYVTGKMKFFKCDYCQQDKSTKGRRRLTDFDNSLLYYCADCMDNPMAQRRMKVVMKKHYGDYYKY
jgi:predicted SprT family Zn-dependent metalloprotease